ncbi:MAG: hypothetical protein E7485_08710 [Ruminococcaceae bacterium]|nr:hypothetical protein [Oscillospiraceae bacterium]
MTSRDRQQKYLSAPERRAKYNAYQRQYRARRKAADPEAYAAKQRQYNITHRQIIRDIAAENERLRAELQKLEN